ncbi:unnamed protein product [Lymnaea stagnalis]|uniref:UDP-N-acetylglucosamine transferase subunit ALG13 n=1 Tax=Lymnaea stagnalis TaxID=6523 RepID=A0AAV2HPE0_LYMST
MEQRKRLFVTVGTTKFDSLIREITSSSALATLSKQGFSDVNLQIGRGDYEPEEIICDKGYPRVKYFRLKDSIAEEIAEANLIICHAGAGSIMDSLGAGKPVLVVINEELMGNHQTELAEKLACEGYLQYCNVSKLVKSLESLDFTSLRPFPPGEPHKFAEYLDNVLGFK